MRFDRSAGILLPIFSLPSKYGIGTLGSEAYKFIDFLVDAKQKYWQILPLGPTGYGDSPYQSFSSFAGNPYFIDLEKLIEAGDISKEEVENITWFTNEEYVDYGLIYNGRNIILEKVFVNSYDKYSKEVEKFIFENKFWIEEYALYMSLKKHFGMKSYIDWDDKEVRLRKVEALDKYKELLKDDIKYYIFIQFLFYKQWAELKKYANDRGVSIIGDIPIYVSLDSSDCFANPELFMLDEENIPTFIAGVPPDYFSEDGQLWGNPLYKWDVMKKDSYKWWKARIEGASKLYDVIRIDHFRGFESFYAVKYGSVNARIGEWIKGPDIDFISEIQRTFPDIKFIAEDLGVVTKELQELLIKSDLPGMKVLSFAFDSGGTNIFLPHFYTNNSVCYVGTHDNDTLVSWMQSVSQCEVDFAREYAAININENFNDAIIKLGMSSVSNLFIAQLQDYMHLGKEARINTPGTAAGNWTWRLKGQVSSELTNKIAHYTTMYAR